MKVVTVAFFMTFMVSSLQDKCLKTLTPTWYSANNQALENHTFQKKTLPSPVMCGQDCTLNAQCVSFNYHANTHVCELNNVTRTHNHHNLVTVQQSMYYDRDMDTPSHSVPYNTCPRLVRAGYPTSGIYTIFPDGLTDGLDVYCDLKTDGGGWIVFQRRQDGSVDFYRDWTEYQSGFGDLSGEFWLGNDNLHALTKSGRWQLRVDMVDWDGETAWVEYGEFVISGETYNISVDFYNAESTAGDSLLYHDGMPFTTKDRNNSPLKTPMSENCVVKYEGAWWSKGCHASHLNGKYYHQSSVSAGHGIQWTAWKGEFGSLKRCEMKMRPVLK